MNVRVERLSKRFGAFSAVEELSFAVERGALVALLGPSGSGKSTVLRLLAGLEVPDGGTVRFDDVDVTAVHPRARSIGFVFQHYALFRHLTVAQNVAFGLEVRRAPKDVIRRRVSELLDRVGLTGLERRYPAQLSGGQRQRVALARALAPEPRLLLLDEPFGAVDAKVREELRQWLRRLHDDVGVTSIFVTHDQEEAFAIADQVVVIHQGRLEQSGTPAQVLDQPASAFVARFVGDVNVFPAVVREGEAVVGALRARLEAPSGPGPVELVVRAHDLELRRREPGNATVERLVVLGDRVRVHARVDGAGPICAHLSRRSAVLDQLVPGCRVEVEVAHARAFPADAPVAGDAVRGALDSAPTPRHVGGRGGRTPSGAG